MSQKDRLENIRTLIKTEQRVAVSELSKAFSVTEETIRRDLEKLEREGLIARTYGGAVLNMGDITRRINYHRRAQTNVEAKKKIAKLVTEIIPCHSAVIGADSSSTVMEAIHMISDREDLLLMTYSANLIREMADAKINIMSTGGILNRKSDSFQGVIARNTLQDYNMDIIMVSCKGLQLTSGIFDTSEDEAELKRIMASRGQKVFLLVDHSKFDQVAFAKLFDLQTVHTVVTDCKPRDEWVEYFMSHNIQLLYP